MTCNKQCTESECCIPYSKASDIHEEIMREDDCDLYMVLCILIALAALCFMCFSWGMEKERDLLYKECTKNYGAFLIKDAPGVYMCARVDLME